MAALELYKRTDDKWAWRLRADNNQIVATDGSQGYNNQDDAENIAKRVVNGDYGIDSVTVITD